MRQLMRRATVLAVAALPLAATSLLALPTTAHAETKHVSCGDEVTAEPGDKVIGTLTEEADGPLKFDLGTVEESTTNLVGTASDLVTGLLGSLADVACEVTVHVADTAEKVPGVDESTSNAVKDGAKQLDKSAHDAAGTADKLTSRDKSEADESDSDGAADDDSDDQQHTSADDGSSEQSSSSEHTGDADNSDTDDSDDNSHAIASPASPASGNGVPLQPAFLPSHFDSDAAPMRDYGGIPHAVAGEFSPAPGVRAGKSVEDYAPRFDLLGAPDESDNTNGSKNTADAGGGSGKPHASADDPDSTVTKAGQAETMRAGVGQSSNPASVPVLLAVVVLAMSTAGLVRTWVLRRV